MSPLEDKAGQVNPLDLKSSGLEDIAMAAFLAHAQDTVEMPNQDLCAPRPSKLPPKAVSSSLLFNLLFMIIFISVGALSSYIMDRLQGGAAPNQVEVNLPNQDYFTKTDINIHRGPGDDYEVVGVAKQGQLFKQATKMGNWIKADYGRYLKADDLGTLPNPDSLSFNAIHKVYGRRNVYQLPFLESEKLGHIVINQGMHLAPIDDDWFHIKTGGYVYLQDNKKTRLMQVVEDEAPIRPGPGEHYEVIGAYYKDKILKVMSKKEGWAKISDGQYVSLKKLKAVRAGRKQATGPSSPP